MPAEVKAPYSPDELNWEKVHRMTEEDEGKEKTR